MAVGWQIGESNPHEVTETLLVFVAAAFVAVAVAGPLLWFVVLPPLRAPAPSRAELDERLDKLITICKVPWKRPPLRGSPTAGNAAVDQMRLVASMSLQPPAAKERSRWIDALRGNLKLYAADIERNIENLDLLLETTQREHSWATSALQDGISDSIPLLSRHRTAYRLLLLRAIGKSTTACMRTIPTVVQLAQDMAVGNAIFGALMLNPIYHDVSDVLNRCSQHAAKTELERTRDELQKLLEHPIEFGRSVRCELALQMATLRKLIDGGLEADPAESRYLWDHLSRASKRIGEGNAQDFPGAIALFKAESSALERAHIEKRALKLYTKLFHGYVAGYAEALALQRAMVVALHAQISGVRDKPPAALGRKDLSDPFNGKPLHWEHIKRCSVIWSIGDNGKSDSRVNGTQFEMDGAEVYVWACFEPVPNPTEDEPT